MYSFIIFIQQESAWKFRKIDLKSILINQLLQMKIHGSPLQLSRREFCLWVAA